MNREQQGEIAEFIGDVIVREGSLTMDNANRVLGADGRPLLDTDEYALIDRAHTLLQEGKVQ